ncbi:MAG: chloride channel protein, partial [Synechococcaceae bacterium WBB_32_011]|nr:chloride channel protein [Synechococcaceae bacterium WBB_32_011]
GPEGPSVESGGNIGLWLGRRAGLTPDALKALVGAGVAAGLAAGFRAPIAGVFFAFEGAYSTIPGRPSLRAVLVAAVSSTLVIQLGLGDEPIFRLPAYEVRSPLELPLYLGLGLLASFVAWALVRLLALGRSEAVQAKLELIPPWLITAVGGLAVGLLALGFPQVLGVGYDTVESLLGSGGGISLLTLLALLIVKLVATGVSNATGFIGGGFGLPVAEAPAYAMVGMAAVLAGAARAPLTALLLLFELTRDIRIVLPLMAATGLSALLVEQAGWVKGLITLADLQQVLNSKQSVSFLQDCLRSELVWLPSSADLSRLEDQLRPNGLRQLPVFMVEDGLSAQLPQGLPPEGLAVTQLQGIASRDGLARALARRIKGYV